MTKKTISITDAAIELAGKYPGVGDVNFFKMRLLQAVMNGELTQISISKNLQDELVKAGLLNTEGVRH
jgi:hypothetical protein